MNMMTEFKEWLDPNADETVIITGLSPYYRKYGDQWEWEGWLRELSTNCFHENPDWPIPNASYFLGLERESSTGEEMSPDDTVARVVLTNYANHNDRNRAMMVVQLEPRLIDVVDLGDYVSLRGTYELHVFYKPEGYSITDSDIDRLSTDIRNYECFPIDDNNEEITARSEMVYDNTRFSVITEKDSTTEFFDLMSRRTGETQINMKLESSSVNRDFSSFHTKTMRKIRGLDASSYAQIYSETMEWDEMEHLLIQQIKNAQRHTSSLYKKKSLIPEHYYVENEETAVPLAGFGFDEDDGVYLEKMTDGDEWTGPGNTGEVLHDYFLESTGPLVFRESCKLTNGTKEIIIQSGVYTIKFSKTSTTSEMAYEAEMDILKKVLVTPIRSRITLSRGDGVVNTQTPLTTGRTNTSTGRFIQTEDKTSVRRI